MGLHPGGRNQHVPIPTFAVATLNPDWPHTVPLVTYTTTGVWAKPAPFRNRVMLPAAIRATESDAMPLDLRGHLWEPGVGDVVC